jgi:hypothetical protein
MATPSSGVIEQHCKACKQCVGTTVAGKVRPVDLCQVMLFIMLASADFNKAKVFCQFEDVSFQLLSFPDFDGFDFYLYK